MAVSRAKGSRWKTGPGQPHPSLYSQPSTHPLFQCWFETYPGEGEILTFQSGSGLNGIRPGATSTMRGFTFLLALSCCLLQCNGQLSPFEETLAAIRFARKNDLLLKKSFPEQHQQPLRELFRLQQLPQNLPQMLLRWRRSRRWKFVLIPKIFSASLKFFKISQPLSSFLMLNRTWSKALSISLILIEWTRFEVM